MLLLLLGEFTNTWIHLIIIGIWIYLMSHFFIAWFLFYFGSCGPPYCWAQCWVEWMKWNKILMHFACMNLNNPGENLCTKFCVSIAVYAERCSSFCFFYIQHKETSLVNRDSNVIFAENLFSASPQISTSGKAEFCLCCQCSCYYRSLQMYMWF